MQIKFLKLFSKNIEAQKEFYQNLLGFSCEERANGFKIITKENSLLFEKSEKNVYYHFAFLIPTDSILEAITFLENKNIRLLPYKGEKIIQFDQGKAIYFFDQDKNIVEFIERPLTNYTKNTTFDIEQVIKLNEIGLPHKTPTLMADILMNNYGIHPINKGSFRENFCWVGDHHGVIIITQEGRNWLPTDKPGVINDFAICYEDMGKEFCVSFESNTIVSLHSFS